MIKTGLKSCLFISLLMYSFTFELVAQKRVYPEDAAEHFKFHNYIDALKAYQMLLKEDPDNELYNFRAGYCVLQIHGDKKPAIQYFEKATRAEKADPDAWYFLALAYHYNYEFDKAEDTYMKYKAIGKGKYQKEVDKQLQYLSFARKLYNDPVDVEFENAGDKINSEYADYNPYITPNESYMVFTSRRKGKGSRETDGYYPSDVYETHVENGEWQTAKMMSSLINSIYDEQIVGLSYDGKTIFIYVDRLKEVGDIYIAQEKNGKFSRIKPMGEPVNTSSFEGAATISADGNTLFFSSDRKGGLGGRDIWMSRKLPNGEWGLPQNLGPNINTPDDEDYPNLFYDGQTLYFASNGRNSIGGMDLFKSTWDPETNTWTPAENLGYPINTPENNYVISFTEDQRHAYVAMWRPDSKGDWDIYRLTFKDKDERQSVVKSKIFTEGSDQPVTDAFIRAVNTRTMQEVGTYIPNPRNGSFIMILKPGHYEIIIEVPGYTEKTFPLTIKGKSDFEEMIEQTFKISKQ